MHGVAGLASYLTDTVVACVAWQARGQRLEDGVEIVALKPCTLRIVEGRCLLAEPARHHC